jgi:hypothetical protein
MQAVEDEIEVALETMLDREGNEAISEEWLVLADIETLHSLENKGYTIASIEKLDGLGYFMGTVRAPATYDPAGENLAAVEVLSSPRVAVDLNHVYMPQNTGLAHNSDAMSADYGSSTTSAWKQIGMIDSSIDTNHAVFKNSEISESAFTPRGRKTTTAHGTAIASILVGESDSFHGFSPSSKLFNGVVFATDDEGREFSTTAAIVRALNWLAEQQVNIINMSLAGPDNAILRKAVESACSRNITLITSVGNAGPAAKPLYPAAYDCTIAVTAVDANGNPYHRASRGNHVDFALPGVDIAHAQSGDLYTTSSGTSFAAAILSGTVISNMPALLAPEEVRQRLKASALDLGAAGNDSIFGHGLIRIPVTARISN